MQIGYEYDLGSSTDLVISVKDYTKEGYQGDNNTILSRNNPQNIKKKWQPPGNCVPGGFLLHKIHLKLHIANQPEEWYNRKDKMLHYSLHTEE